MAHLPPKNLSAFEPFYQPGSQRKTLFMAAGNPAALLVTLRAGRRRARVLNFASPEAALQWTIRHAAAFVHLPGNANPSLN